MQESIRIRRNIKLFPYFNFFRFFRPDIIISIICFSQILGSYTKAMSYVTVSIIAGFIMEIPTGIISDKIGRKNTLMLAVLCMISKYVFAILAIINSSYLFILIVGVFHGTAAAFYSGTNTALLYETMTSLKKKHKYHHAFGKTTSTTQVAMGLSAIAGGVIAQRYSFIWIFSISLVSQIITLGITLFFIEPKYVEKSVHSFTKHFWEGLKLIIKNQRLRIFTIAHMVRIGTDYTSFSFQPVFFASVAPLWAVGFARTLAHFVGFASYWFAGKVIDKIGYLKSLVMGTVFCNVINLIAVLISSFITPFIASIENFSFGIIESAKEGFVQSEFSDKQRATMESIMSFLRAIFHSIVALGVGYIADIYSPKISLIILYIIGMGGAFIYYKALKK